MKKNVLAFLLTVVLFTLSTPARSVDLACSSLVKNLDVKGRGWDLDDTLRSEISDLMKRSDLPMDQKLTGLFDLMVMDQKNRLPSKKQKKIHDLTDKVINSHNYDELITSKLHEKMLDQAHGELRKMGPHYIPFIRSIYYGPNHADERMVIQDVLIKFHEYLHAIDGASSSYQELVSTIVRIVDLSWVAGPRVMLPLSIHRAERIAVGSQWEFLNPISWQDRAHIFIEYLGGLIENYRYSAAHNHTLKQKLSNIKFASEKEFIEQGQDLWLYARNTMSLSGAGEFDKGLANVVTQSLLNAHLSKAEFLKAQMKVHNYDLPGLFKHSNKLTVARGVLLAAGAYQVYRWLSSEPEQRADMRFRLLPIDVFFYLSLLNYLQATDS